jgi:N-acetylmuramoyl-L-alanine amidase
VDPSGLPTVARNRYRIVIDPGHGGPDPGAIGIGGLRETDVVLDVSLQVADLLRARGVDVRLTRTREVDVDLPPRVSLANRSGATAFVSIHANALSMNRPDVNGIETFFFSDPPFWTPGVLSAAADDGRVPRNTEPRRQTRSLLRDPAQHHAFGSGGDGIRHRGD